MDSARFYRNEGPCSEAIKKSGLPRSQIFFTTKVPPPSVSYDGAKASIESTFKQTGLDYIDLYVFFRKLTSYRSPCIALKALYRYLIHAPYGGKEGRTGAWRALVEAQQAGKIRSLGVSNYGVHHLDELEAYIKELESQNGPGKGGEISVGQWELHPWLTRPDIVEWCKKRHVICEAYCPVVRGQKSDDATLQSLAKKHGKTAAQVLLRWSIQKVAAT